MTAKFWTTNGGDIWRVSKREVFDFVNLDTKDVVTCDCVSEIVDKGFLPGTFDSELLAAAAYQERIGNKKEAQRLLNEYQEGDPQSPALFPSEQ